MTEMFQKFIPLWVSLCAFFQAACGQNNPANRLGHCENPTFDREVASWLRFTVPAIDVDTLYDLPAASVLILDAREPGEYAVSHIEGAVNCGYDHFDRAMLDTLDKSRPVVVYCSIGYRSEKIAQKLIKAGFTNVSNLYGSIFEWVNRGYPLVDANGQRTVRLHTFNSDWGRWVSNSSCEKVTTGNTPAPQQKN